MTQLGLTFTAVAIFGIAFLLWLKTKSGKKWLENL